MIKYDAHGKKTMGGWKWAISTIDWPWDHWWFTGHWLLGPIFSGDWPTKFGCENAVLSHADIVVVPTHRKCRKWGRSARSAVESVVILHQHFTGDAIAPDYSINMAKDQASSLAFGLTCQWVSVQNVSHNGKESIHSHKRYPILWPLENWENSGRFRGSNHLKGGKKVHRLSQDYWLWKFGLGADQSCFIKTNRLQCLGVLHPLLVLPEFGKDATYFANWAIVFGPRFTTRWLRAIPLGLSAGLMLQGKGSGWIIDIANFRPLVILRWMLIYGFVWK